MKILALETSAKSVSCAVVEDGAPLASAYQCTGLTHSRTLLPMVDAMLKNADLTLDDINAIAIAAGPGSFTGLRIGNVGGVSLGFNAMIGGQGPCRGRRQAVPRRFDARGHGAECRAHRRAYRRRDGRAPLAGL